MNTTNKVQVGDPTIGTSTTTTSQWQTYTHPKAEQGWECPRCGRINAPWVRQCDCSRSNWTITSNDWTYKPEQWKEITCSGTSSQVQLDSDTFRIHPESDPKYQVGGSDYYNPNTCTYENTIRNINNATDGKHYQGCTYTCKKI